MAKAPLRTYALFYEHWPAARRHEWQPPFTLKREDITRDGVKYKSLFKIYMRHADPTEYKFAIATFGEWRVWKKMIGGVLKAHIELWREELEVKLRSDGIQGVIKDAKATSRTSVSSAKWLADKGWLARMGKGKPSKKTIEAEAAKQQRIQEDIDEDLKRMDEALH